MSATGSWADLNSDLLVSIINAAGDGSSLGDYARLRSVCTAWRSALAPLYPSVINFADNGGCASIFSIPTRLSLNIHTTSSKLAFSLQDQLLLLAQPVHSEASIVGSGSGHVAVAIQNQHRVCGSLKHSTARIFLLNPHTGQEVGLLPPTSAHDQWVRKVVFAPNSSHGHGGPKERPIVVALYGRNKVAYIDAAGYKEWTTVDVPGDAAEQLVDLAFDGAGSGNGKVYCLDLRGGVRVVRITRSGRNSQDHQADEPSLTALPSAPGTFSPPYDVASTLTPTKHLFFFHGKLYQVWQNSNATVNLDSGFTMSAYEILVLRCDQGRWDVVKDLGGYSVFISKYSNTTVVRAAGVPGVRADCVYWINHWSGVAMLCDIATSTSEPCVLPYGACKGDCWYFGDDNMTD